MDYKEVMEKLESLGTSQNRKIYTNHGCDIDQFGVSVANLKKVAKRLKNNHELGYQLFYSNNADAIYMSQWIVDSSELDMNDITRLIDTTSYYMILDTVIPSLVVKNKVLTWEILPILLHHENGFYRQVGYSLYSYILGMYPNEEIDETHVLNELNHIHNVIHEEENRVKYNMNGFLISAGIYNSNFTDLVISLSKEIGKVKVYMGNTSCKTPYAPDYIEKVKSMNRIGTKRK